MPRVVLLSGGLDSALCLAMHAGCEGDPVATLFVNYGQPHASQEVAAATVVSAHYDLALEHVTTTPLPLQFRGDPRMLIPGRNLLLLGLGAQLVGEGGSVVIGVHAEDHDDYPDCRRPFMDAVERATGVQVLTPLLTMTKPAIGRAAEAWGVPVEQTWSCYYPDGDQPCGKCNACQGRVRALG